MEPAHDVIIAGQPIRGQRTGEPSGVRCRMWGLRSLGYPLGARLGKIMLRNLCECRGGSTMKTEILGIVDHGRGPQLSSCRITVQDLLPYFREGSVQRRNSPLDSFVDRRRDRLAQGLYPRPFRRSRSNRKGHQGVSRPHACPATGLDASQRSPFDCGTLGVYAKKTGPTQNRTGTVLTLLLDENIDGYAEYLSRFVFSSAWNDLSSSLGVRIVTFEEAGLRQ